MVYIQGEKKWWNTFLDGNPVGIVGNKNVPEPVDAALAQFGIVQREVAVVVVSERPRDVVVERPAGGHDHVCKAVTQPLLRPG